MKHVCSSFRCHFYVLRRKCFFVTVLINLGYSLLLSITMLLTMTTQRYLVLFHPFLYQHVTLRRIVGLFCLFQLPYILSYIIVKCYNFKERTIAIFTTALAIIALFAIFFMNFRLFRLERTIQSRMVVSLGSVDVENDQNTEAKETNILHGKFPLAFWRHCV